MVAPRFVHLRLHSEYSIVDGMARVDDAVAAAAADGMPALAVTDQSNLFGVIKFFQPARAAGVRNGKRAVGASAHRDVVVDVDELPCETLRKESRDEQRYIAEALQAAVTVLG